jgi:hypothetical protein
LSNNLGQVYWDNYFTGDVGTVPVTGGAFTTLGNVGHVGVNGPQGLLVLGGTLYVSMHGRGNTGMIVSMPITGGPVTTVIPMVNAPDGLVTDGTSFFIGSYDDSAVYTAPVAGGAVTTFAPALGHVNDLAIDSSNLYVAVFGGDVLRLPLTGAGPVTDIVPGANAYSVRVDATWVFFTTQAGELKRTLKSGGPVESYGNITGLTYTALTIDASYAYLATYLANTMWKVPLALGGACQ